MIPYGRFEEAEEVEKKKRIDYEKDGKWRDEEDRKSVEEYTWIELL